MIDFKKEMAAILEEDPLGLLAAKPKASGTATADERLISSFEEINTFVRSNHREPSESRDIGERKLYSRLKGLRENPDKAASLIEYDELNLLEGCLREDPAIYTTADVLEHDPLGLLGEDKTEEIFTFRHIPQKVSQPDHVAYRKKCDEFEKFEPLFKQCHQDLKSGKKTTIPYQSERQIVEDSMFILHGALVYVGARGTWETKKGGKKDARLYCVFENGTESNMLLRSLATSLWKDEGRRQVVDATQKELFEKLSSVGQDDKSTGSVYVLRSLSKRPEIREIQNLYKIGFSTVPVNERIKNAANEPTYLMADVKLLEEYEIFNIDAQKVETLLHHFFADACVEIDVFDQKGNRHSPREWFVIPRPVIAIAVELLRTEEIVNYKYDAAAEEIVPL